MLLAAVSAVAEHEDGSALVDLALAACAVEAVHGDCGGVGGGSKRVGRRLL